jgi:hypothetical protein
MTDEEMAESVIEAGWLTTGDLRDTLVAAFAAARAEALEEAHAEIDRLQAIVGQAPHTAFLEAVQRACDERLGEQKHRIRELEAALAAARARGGTA